MNGRFWACTRAGLRRRGQRRQRFTLQPLWKWGLQGKPLFPRHFLVLPQHVFEALCGIFTSNWCKWQAGLMLSCSLTNVMAKCNGRLLFGSLSGRTPQQQSAVLQASHRHEKWRIARHYLLVNLFSAVLPDRTALIIIIQQIKFNLCELLSVNILTGICLQ